MNVVWLTTTRANGEQVVNPLYAACEAGFRPGELHVLGSPAYGSRFEAITDRMKQVVANSGGDEPQVFSTHIDDETDVIGTNRILTNRLPGSNSPAERQLLISRLRPRFHLSLPSIPG